MKKLLLSLKIPYMLPLLLLVGCTMKAIPTASPVPPTEIPSPLPTDTPIPTATPTITPTHEPLYLVTATAIPKESSPLLLVHFMPWYQAPPVSGPGAGIGQ